MREKSRKLKGTVWPDKIGLRVASVVHAICFKKFYLILSF
jgi:hypothetical protein